MALSLPQLTLALFDDPYPDLADYIPGPNTLVLTALGVWAAGGGPWCVLLSGAPGSGKSHLIQGALRAVDEGRERTMYVPLGDVLEYGPALLDGLDAIDFLAIDDIDAGAGDPAWERGLFDLFNRLHAAECHLLISASTGPRGFRFALPDLSSRLSSALSYKLAELDDDDKQTLLQRRAARRGLSMPAPVARYLISRLRRDMHALNEIFERIDAASLSSGRELTIPFVRDVLGFDDGSAE
jgi:DnaA family protein